MSQRFTGQYRDTETGVDFFNARYFGSALGRFTSPDPMNAGANASDPQTWNGYAYVRNNPLNATDPSGLIEQVCDDWSCGGWGNEPCFTFDASCAGPGPVPPCIWCGGGGTQSGGGGGAPSNPTPPTSPAPPESIPPGSFPGGENLGLPPWLAVPVPLSWQALLNLWDWDCSSGVCYPGFFSDSYQSVFGGQSNSGGYWGYAGCLVTVALPHAILNGGLGIGGTAVLGKSFNLRFTPPPGVMGKIPERAATTGLKWGLKGNIVGAIVFAVPFEVDLNKGAKVCAAANGYTPWILQ